MAGFLTCREGPWRLPKLLICRTFVRVTGGALGAFSHCLGLATAALCARMDFAALIHHDPLAWGELAPDDAGAALVAMRGARITDQLSSSGATVDQLAGAALHTWVPSHVGQVR